MRIGVTGGSGFVGKYLINELLKSQHQVNALSRRKRKNNDSGLIWYEGDINDEDSLSYFLKDCDVVCNCAGEITDSKNYTRNNVNGVKVLHNASIKSGVNLFIQLSSAGIYKVPIQGKVREDSEIYAYDEYERSKINAEKWLFDQKKMNVIILRPTTVYGADMPNQSLKNLFSAILNDRFFFIGSKKAVSCYISVENLTDAILKVIEKRKEINFGGTYCEAFNISDDLNYYNFINLACRSLSVKPTSIRIPLRLILFLLKLNKSSLNINIPLTEKGARSLAKQSTFSSKKFRTIFSWKHRFPHSETIDNCIKEWFEI